jgi:hypothetical protein
MVALKFLWFTSNEQTTQTQMIQIAFKPQVGDYRTLAFYEVEDLEVVLVRMESGVELDKHLMYFGLQRLIECLRVPREDVLRLLRKSSSVVLDAPTVFQLSRYSTGAMVDVLPKKRQELLFRQGKSFNSKTERTFVSHDWLSRALKGVDSWDRCLATTLDFFTSGCDFVAFPPTASYVPMNKSSEQLFDSTFGSGEEDVVPGFAQLKWQDVQYAMDKTHNKRSRDETPLPIRILKSSTGNQRITVFRKKRVVQDPVLELSVPDALERWGKQIELESAPSPVNFEPSSCLSILSQALHGANPMRV